MRIPIEYESVTIREIFDKFKIVDTRISDEVLDISIDKVSLKDFKKDKSEGEKIIVTGDYTEPMIKSPNNKVELILEVDPLEEWNHVKIIKTLKGNFTSGRIYNNEGMGHTIT